MLDRDSFGSLADLALKLSDAGFLSSAFSSSLSSSSCPFRPPFPLRRLGREAWALARAPKEIWDTTFEGSGVSSSEDEDEEEEEALDWRDG